MSHEGLGGGVVLLLLVRADVSKRIKPFGSVFTVCCCGRWSHFPLVLVIQTRVCRSLDLLHDMQFLFLPPLTSSSWRYTKMNTVKLDTEVLLQTRWSVYMRSLTLYTSTDMKLMVGRESARTHTMSSIMSQWLVVVVCFPFFFFFFFSRKHKCTQFPNQWEFVWCPKLASDSFVLELWS